MKETGWHAIYGGVRDIDDKMNDFLADVSDSDVAEVVSADGMLMGGKPYVCVLMRVRPNGE